jgi:hypothetical protein
MTELLKLSEAARIAGISGETLRKHIRWGTLPAHDVSVPGSSRPTWRIDPSELNNWLQTRKSGHEKI